MRTRIALLALLVLVSTGLLVSPAAHAEDGAERAMDRFTACLAGSGGGDMVLLFDESRSLTTSDRDNGRVVAARYLVNRLAQLAERTDIDLTMMMAGFGTSYRDHGARWLSVASDKAELLEQAASFADRNTDTGTDYWTGLDGARKALAERAKSDNHPCQAIFFFSDGKLDVSLSPEEEKTGRVTENWRPFAPENDLSSRQLQNDATSAAFQSMCRPGGLADQLRLQDVVLFGVGLSGEGEDPDVLFDIMRGVVTGTGPRGECGEQLKPVPGDFVPAADIDSLLFAFDAVTRPAAPVEMPICQGAVCPDGMHQVVLDASVSEVDLLGSSDASGIDVHVTAPDGTSLVLERGAAIEEVQALNIAGATGEYSWLSDRSFTMKLAAGDESTWTGVWTVAFVDPASASPGKKSRTSLYVSGDLRPRWTPPNDARIGDPLPVELGLLDFRGEPVDPAGLLGTARVTASLVGADGDLTPVGELQGPDIATPLTLDTEGWEPGQHTMRIRLAASTAGATLPDGREVPGTDLTPQVIDVPFVLAPRPGYPTVAQTVDFGAAEGAPTLTAGLPITGPGCVWLNDGPQLLAAPDGVSSVAVTSSASDEASCVRVEEGNAGELPLTLSSDESGNGALRGRFSVAMTTLEGGDPVHSDVAFSAELTKDLNPPKFWTVLLLAALFGPGIPLLLAYLLKWLLASKIPAGGLNAAVVPITVTDGLVRRDGGLVELRSSDLSNLVSVAKPSRRVSLPGGISLRTKMGASPFGSGRVVVESPGRIGVSKHNPVPQGKLRQAELPLAVQNQWVLLADPAAPDRADLLLLTSTLASLADQEKLLDDAVGRAPALLEELVPAGIDDHGGETSGDMFDRGSDASATDDLFVPETDHGFDFFDTPPKSAQVSEPPMPAEPAPPPPESPSPTEQTAPVESTPDDDDFDFFVIDEKN